MLINKNLIWISTILTSMVAAVLGLYLRWYFVHPLDINFKYLLHAHSHAMLLGWLLPGFILLIYKQWNIEPTRLHSGLLGTMALAVIGMMISFSLQGYGLASIAFSALHLWISYILLIKLSKIGKRYSLSGRLVKTGVIFFFISSIGPYTLGPLAAHNLKDSVLYDQAIFFYLHFLYNGTFFFFTMAYLATKLNPELTSVKKLRFTPLLLIGTILTWFHMLDYSYDFPLLNILSGIGAIMLLWAVITFVKRVPNENKSLTLKVIITLLLVKFIFQIIGSFPEIANEIVNGRNLLIAYLHFIFLGIYSPLIWQGLKNGISNYRMLIIGYFTMFFLTELALTFPYIGIILNFKDWPMLNFVLYASFVLIWLIMGFSAIRSVQK